MRREDKEELEKNPDGKEIKRDRARERPRERARGMLQEETAEEEKVARREEGRGRWGLSGEGTSNNL